MSTRLLALEVAVLYGGRSGERAVSVDSAEQVLAALWNQPAAPDSKSTSAAQPPPPPPGVSS